MLSLIPVIIFIHLLIEALVTIPVQLKVERLPCSRIKFPQLSEV